MSTQRSMKFKSNSVKIRYQELYVVMKESPVEFSSNQTIQSPEPEHLYSHISSHLLEKSSWSKKYTAIL